MTSLTLSQTRQVNGDTTYSVINTITASVGIPREAFVYVYGTNDYSRVASAFDILSFPNTPDPTKGYYRTATVTLTYPAVADAQAASTSVKTAIQDLVTTYAAAVTAFQGSDTTTYTG